MNIEKLSVVQRQTDNSFCSCSCLRSWPMNILIVYKFSLGNFSNEHLWSFVDHSHPNWSSDVLSFIIFKRKESFAWNSNFGISRSKSTYREEIDHCWIIVVGECVFDISFVESFVLDELLSIHSNWYNNCIGNINWRSLNNKLMHIYKNRFDVISSKSDCHVANRSLTKSKAFDFNLCTSSLRTHIWDYLSHLRFLVICEFLSWTSKQDTI